MEYGVLEGAPVQTITLLLNSSLPLANIVSTDMALATSQYLAKDIYTSSLELFLTSALPKKPLPHEVELFALLGITIH